LISKTSLELPELALNALPKTQKKSPDYSPTQAAKKKKELIDSFIKKHGLQLSNITSNSTVPQLSLQPASPSYKYITSNLPDTLQ